MNNVFYTNFALSGYIRNAQVAVTVEPTMVSIWAIAEYLDLVGAKEVPRNTALVAECNSAVKRFVMKNLRNDAYVPFWEKAGCLFRAYKHALRMVERTIDQDLLVTA